MPLQLRCHPDFTCDAVDRIEVFAERSADRRLTLRYLVFGTIGDLLLPQPQAPIRGQALWEHGCFEGFIRAAGDSYYEFNFAPSGEWAAYSFCSHRSGMKDVETRPPHVEQRSSSSSYEMRVELDLGDLAELPDAAAWQLSLSAIVEETSERKSYWALAHPPGKADFHHDDGFVLNLPPVA